MERKIVVPAGMLKAAREVKLGYTQEARDWAVLKAVLEWLGENPILPTEQQLEVVMAGWRSTGVQQGPFFSAPESSAFFAIRAWQREMFLAPLPPEETDLISIANKLTSNPDWRRADLYHALLEAFNRGKASRS